MKKVLHLTHDLTGSNGINTYIKSMVDLIECDHFIAVKKGKYNVNKNSFNNVHEIASLSEIGGLVDTLKIDILIIHYPGPESWKDEELFYIMENQVCCKKKITFDIDRNGFALCNVFNTWIKDLSKKPKIVIVAHSSFKLPGNLYKPRIDSIVSVSKKVFNIQCNHNAEHSIIYPVVNLPFKEFSKKPGVTRIGWLGHLSKYDNPCYQALKKQYGNKEGIEFLFSGAGLIDYTPPDNFKMLGVQDPADFLPGLDVFLYPTVNDTFSIALLEAATAGAVCLASEKVNELARLIGVSTFARPENMLKKLDFLINNYQRFNTQVNTTQQLIKLSFNKIKFAQDWDFLLNFEFKEVLLT